MRKPLVTRHRLLRIGKKGEAKTTSEDAGAGNDTARVYAVADGATRSFLPGPWAQFLVDAACASGLPTKRELTRWLAGPREQWRERQAEAAASGAWWNNQGRRGAATFCGIALEYKNDLVEWSAVTIGDACVFVTRENRLLRALPLESSDAFNSNPRCLFSTPSDPEPEITIWNDNDNTTTEEVFILATDALAKWLLQRHEAGKPMWNRISQIVSEDELLQLVDQERDANRMENDDITLLVVRMEKEPDTDAKFALSATEPTQTLPRDQVPHQQKPIAKTSTAQALSLAHHTTRKLPARKESTSDEPAERAEPLPARKSPTKETSILDESAEFTEPERHKAEPKGKTPGYSGTMLVSAVVSAVVSLLVSFCIQTRVPAPNSPPAIPSSGNATTAPSRGAPVTTSVSHHDASVSSSIPSTSASTATDVTITGWVDCSEKDYGKNPKDEQHQFWAHVPVYEDKGSGRMLGKLLDAKTYLVTDHNVRPGNTPNRCQIQIESSNLKQ